MGQTRGSLEVKTLYQGSVITTETIAEISDSDNDPGLLKSASEIISKLSTIITTYHSLRAAGHYLPDERAILQKYLGG